MEEYHSDYRLFIVQDEKFTALFRDNAVAHITRLTRVINEVDVLRTIIENMTPLDYTLIYNAKDEHAITRIEELREELKRTSDSKKIREINTELKKYEPKIDVKYSILIDVMLEKIKKLNSGFGVNNSFPYFYNGCYWEFILEDMAKEVLILVAQNSGFNYYDVRGHKCVDGLYKEFCLPSHITTPKKDLNLVKVNFKNGRLTIEKGQPIFEPVFDPNDFFKYQLSFDFNTIATAPKFQKYLDRVLPEKEAQMVVAEYLGYIFLDLKLEKCMVLVGPGHSGKSVMHDIVFALLGKENVSSYTLNNLCDNTGYYRAQLTNVLLNYCSELGGKDCNPDMVKQLISGEPVSCRTIYRAPFILTDYCKFMFNTNLIPRDIEQTSAYFRRFIFVFFGEVISTEERNVNLAKEIIQDELSGIFNWILEGLSRITQNKCFTTSKHINSTMEKIKSESNSVVLFMKENNYKPSLTEHKILSELFSSYKSFCETTNHRPVSNIEFSRRLEEAGYKVERKKTNNQTWVFCVSDQNERQKQIQKETDDIIEKFMI
jgi:putative DNA primase/helicase